MAALLDDLLCFMTVYGIYGVAPGPMKGWQEIRWCLLPVKQSISMLQVFGFGINRCQGMDTVRPICVGALKLYTLHFYTP